MDYFKPTTLTEALELRRSTAGAMFIAGGTDLMVRFRKEGRQRPSALISLRNVEGLHGIQVSPEVVRLGALTTMGDIARHAGLAAACPALVLAARRVGSPQIRNVATVGGNLCNASPCADTAPPLLVQDAWVELSDAKGSRKVGLEYFFTAPGETGRTPGEVLTAICLRPLGPGQGSAFRKKGRVRMDLAQASVAAFVEMEGDTCRAARLAAGSVAPTPVLLEQAAAVLTGARLSDEVLQKAAAAAEAEVSPITDIRSSDWYRRRIVGVYVKRLVQDLRGAS